MRAPFALLLTVLASIPAAATERPEIDVFAGISAPVDQDDTASAFTGGARLRIPAFGHFRLEPAFTYFNMDREPYRVQGVVQEPRPWYIMGATLGLTYGKNFGAPRFHPYATLGVGYYFLRKREAPDENRPGGQLQLGVSMNAFPNLSLDLNGGSYVISLEGGGTRLLTSLTIGFNYHFGQF